MGDSFCDMFMKEHEKYLPIHAMIQASTVKPKPKIPYQLDLEVKGRKPSIIPKVGDRVKIKSWEWYEKWKDEDGNVNVPQIFIPPMAEFCGKVLTVEELWLGRFMMKEVGHKWNFSLEMFEDVYPVQAQLSSEVKGSELVLSKEEQERLLQKIRDTFEVKPKLKQVKTIHLLRFKKL